MLGSQSFSVHCCQAQGKGTSKTMCLHPQANPRIGRRSGCLTVCPLQLKWGILHNTTGSPLTSSCSSSAVQVASAQCCSSCTTAVVTCCACAWLLRSGKRGCSRQDAASDAVCRWCERTRLVQRPRTAEMLAALPNTCACVCVCVCVCV